MNLDDAYSKFDWLNEILLEDDYNSYLINKEYKKDRSKLIKAYNSGDVCRESALAEIIEYNKEVSAGRINLEREQLLIGRLMNNGLSDLISMIHDSSNPNSQLVDIMSNSEFKRSGQLVKLIEYVLSKGDSALKHWRRISFAINTFNEISEYISKYKLRKCTKIHNQYSPKYSEVIVNNLKVPNYYTALPPHLELAISRLSGDITWYLAILELRKNNLTLNNFFKVVIIDNWVCYPVDDINLTTLDNNLFMFRLVINKTTATVDIVT